MRGAKVKALLLVAHGSHKSSSNDEIRALAAHLRTHNASTTAQFALVEHAFLEMTEPTIADGGNRLIAQGATEIIIFPYFLGAGQHVTVDIPAAAALLAQQHPTISITIAPHLGGATDMGKLIGDHLQPATTAPKSPNALRK